MSEEKKEVKVTEETKEEVKEEAAAAPEDSKEPIDSIEETVADLKKKIEELSDEEDEKQPEEDKLSIPKFITDEQKAKIAEIKEKAAATVNESIDDIKKKSSDAVNNADLQKTVAFIKANAVKAVDAAKVKIDEIKNNPNIQQSVKNVEGKTSDTLKNAKEKLAPYAQQASAAIQSGTKTVVKNVDEFMNKPEVKDNLNKAREKVSDLANKGVEAVKEFFSDEKDDNQE